MNDSSILELNAGFSLVITEPNSVEFVLKSCCPEILLSKCNLVDDGQLAISLLRLEI